MFHVCPCLDELTGREMSSPYDKEPQPDSVLSVGAVVYDLKLPPAQTLITRVAIIWMPTSSRYLTMLNAEQSTYTDGNSLEHVATAPCNNNLPQRPATHPLATLSLPEIN